MDKRIVVLNNGAEEEASSVTESLRSSGLNIETIQLTKGEPLPKAFENVSGLLILGGPITIYDQDTTPCLKVYFNA
jgi:GMP synthase-like glutamine amidotransferase